MTYKEGGNTFLRDSGTVCPVPDIVYARNGYLYGIEDGVPRNITPLTGNVQKIWSSDNTNFNGAKSLVHAGNYIYFFYYHNYTDFYVVEVNLSTLESIQIKLEDNGVPQYNIGGGIAYIENRKVLVCSDRALDTVVNVYVADFVKQTAAIVVTQPEAFCARAIVRNNHIWLYIFGYNDVVNGWKISYQDYTANSSWGEISISENYDTISYLYPFFSGTDYLVWFIAKIIPGTGYVEAKAYSLILSDNTVQYSSWIPVINYYTTSANVYYGLPSFSNGRVYSTVWSSFSTNFYEGVCEYNPSTNSFSLLSSQIITTFGELSILFSNSEDVFLWNVEDETFHNLSGIGGDGAVLPKENMYAFSFLMDTNVNRIVMANYIAGNSVITFSASGGSGQTISTPASIDSIYHMGNILIVYGYGNPTNELYMIT